MSNIIAGIVRGQVPYLEEHIAQKKAVYERYKAGLADLPVKMNPFDAEKSVPNFWLSCITIDEDAMAPFVRGEQDQLWKTEPGKSSPGEILAAIAAFNAEGRPVWKPMHMQPIYRTNAFITAEGNGRGKSNAYIEGNILHYDVVYERDEELSANCFCLVEQMTSAVAGLEKGKDYILQFSVPDFVLKPITFTFNEELHKIFDVESLYNIISTE